jgi:hypothetical protein
LGSCFISELTGCFGTLAGLESIQTFTFAGELTKKPFFGRERTTNSHSSFKHPSRSQADKIASLTVLPVETTSLRIAIIPAYSTFIDLSFCLITL